MTRVPSPNAPFMGEPIVITLRPTRVAAVLAVASLALISCSGHADNVLGSQSLSKHHTTLNIKIAGSSQQSALHRLMVKRRLAERLTPKYVSLATNGLAVWAWPQGTTEPTNPTAVADVSATSPYCTVASDGSGDRTCAVPVSAPSGTDDFQVNGYDQPPSGGNPAGNELETGFVSGVVIQPSQPNTVNVTFDGLIASLSTAPTWMTSQNDGSTHNYSFAVNAYDADNYVIIDTAPFANTLNVAVQNDPTGTLTVVPPGSGTDPRFYGLTYNGGTTNPTGAPDAQLIASASGVTGTAQLDFTPLVLAPQKISFTHGGSGATFTAQLAVPAGITPQSYQQFVAGPSVSGNCMVDGLPGNVPVSWTNGNPVSFTVTAANPGNCTIDVIGPETYSGFALGTVQVTVN